MNAISGHSLSGGYEGYRGFSHVFISTIIWHQVSGSYIFQWVSTCTFFLMEFSRKLSFLTNISNVSALDEMAKTDLLHVSQTYTWCPNADTSPTNFHCPPTLSRLSTLWLHSCNRATGRRGNMCEKNSSEGSILPLGEHSLWRSCEKHPTAKKPTW